MSIPRVDLFWVVCLIKTKANVQPFEELEKKLLNGQKLQGTATAEEVNTFLTARKRAHAYPLFEKVYKISFQGLPVKEIATGW